MAPSWFASVRVTVMSTLSQVSTSIRSSLHSQQWPLTFYPHIKPPCSAAFTWWISFLCSFECVCDVAGMRWELGNWEQHVFDSSPLSCSLHMFASFCLFRFCAQWQCRVYRLLFSGINLHFHSESAHSLLSNGPARCQEKRVSFVTRPHYVVLSPPLSVR